MKHLQLRLPDDLHAWLRDYAERDRRSINAVLTILVEQARAADEQDKIETRATRRASQPRE